MEAQPIGTVRIKSRTVRKQERRQRFIKVSHHGGYRDRWQPFARVWWEQNVGPIPDGHQVIHKDGDSLNDSPSNLVLAREDRFRLLFQSRSEAARHLRIRRAAAVAKSNRDRARVYTSQISPNAWYVVLPRSKAIVWIPCRSRREATELFTAEQLTALCEREIMSILARDKRPRDAEPFEPGHSVEIIRGSTISAQSGTDGACEGFVRLIPDERKPPRKRGAKFLPPDLVTVCGDGYFADVIEPLSNP